MLTQEIIDSVMIHHVEQREHPILLIEILTEQEMIWEHMVARALQVSITVMVTDLL